MKVTIGGKRYDSDKCEILGNIDHYSYSNNYCGNTKLLRAANGTLLDLTQSNGQDLYMRDSFGILCMEIDDFEMNEEQEKRCAELGLIELI